MLGTGVLESGWQLADLFVGEQRKTVTSMTITLLGRRDTTTTTTPDTKWGDRHPRIPMISR